MSPTTYGADVVLGVTVGGTPYQSVDPPAALCVRASEAVVVVAVQGRSRIRRGPMNNVQTIAAFEGVDLVVMARPVHASRQVIYQSDVGSALLSVFDLSSDSKATAVHSEQLDVASVMQTELVLDAAWNADGSGYSFRHELAGDAYSFEGGRTYRLEYVLLTDDYGPVPFVVEVQTQSLFTPRAEF
jgi:hypothetical protein